MQFTEQLRAAEQKYDEIAAGLESGGYMDDPAKLAAWMKEYKQLTPLMETYRAWKQAQTVMQEAGLLLEDSGTDSEFRALAQEEYTEAKKKSEQLQQELQVLLLPQDPDGSRNVIVEIRGGAGGEEAALFAHSLHRMYSMYAERHGWKQTVMSLNATELGGVKEITFSLEGENVYARMKFESGVHRVQRVPETESQGRVHTSTVTVAVLPEVEAVELEINPNDLRIDTFRSSGAGGQHINKTSSAIRVTHIPSGMVVECQDERSQHKNKDRALSILRARLYAQKQAAQDAEIASNRRAQVGTGDRSEKIRTYNFPQSRLTDHRIGLSLYRLDDVMDGDLDAILDALAAAEQAALLAGQKEE